MKKCTLFILGIGMSLVVSAQSTPTPIGRYVGDLKISSLLYSSFSATRLKDLVGKVVILDFWSTRCTSCFKTFPMASKLQKTFGNQLVFLYVTTDSRKEVEDFFSRRPQFKQEGLQFVTDAVELDKAFPHGSLPYYIWIGKDGRVKAVTETQHVTEANIKRLIQTNAVTLPLRKTYANFNFAAPFAENGDLAASIIGGATLTDMVPGLPGLAGFRDLDNGISKLYAMNHPIKDLYTFVYGPKIKILPPDVTRLIRVQVKDSTKFYSNLEKPLEQRRYCFEVLLKLDCGKGRNLPLLQRAQTELDHLLGVKSEVRSELTPCYIISPATNFVVAVDKKGTTEEGIDYTLFTSQSPLTVISRIKSYFKSTVPILFEGFGDQRLNAKVHTYHSFEELQSELLKMGLQIKQEQRVISLLYITDSN